MKHACSMCAQGSGLQLVEGHTASFRVEALAMLVQGETEGVAVCDYNFGAHI